MSKLKTFTSTIARPLPVIVLADTSGSMSVDGKIQALNVALSTMLQSFSDEEEGRAQVQLGVITFGGTAELHQPLVAASEIESLQALSANGGTPMGGAFEIVQEMIEDKDTIPSRAYTPVIILVSDGQPNDDWEGPLERLLGSERARKAQRFALGIGEDADASVLKRFLDDPEAKVFGANDAAKVKEFFRWVTMSVAARSRSVTPNASVSTHPPTDLDELL